MIVLNNDQQDKLVEQFVELQVDSMDTKVTCLDYKQLEVIKSDLLLWRGA